MKKLDYFKDVMQRKGITDKNVLERVTKNICDNIGKYDELEVDFVAKKTENIIYGTENMKIKAKKSCTLNNEHI